MMPRILIAGAGPTGSICAHIMRKELQQKIQIDVWDKSRGSGGRMSTSRDPENPDCIADLGAQYITVTPEYANTHKSFHDDLDSAGLVEPLTGGIEGMRSSPPNTLHYVTPHGISSVVKHFLKKSGSNVLFNHHLSSLELHGKGTDKKLHAVLSSEQSDEAETNGIYPSQSVAYDAVILTMPTPQVLKLGGLVAQKLDEKPFLKETLEKVNYSSRYALALFYGPDVTLEIPWKARYEKDDNCIRWISVDNRKRQNDKACTALVIHTSVPFGIKYLETDKSEVEGIIRKHLDDLIPGLPEPARTKCQRWRYSQVSTPCQGSPGTMVVDEGSSHLLLVAGDGMSHSNLDGCIDSAETTCKYLIDHWRTNSQI